MKIAFLGGMFPKENLEEILKKSSGVVQSAADALQKSIIEGLGAYDLDVEIINLPFIGSYPKRYSDIFSQDNSFTIKSHYGRKNTIAGQNIRFFNLSLVKYASIYRAAKEGLLRWAKKSDDSPRIIVVYSLFNSLLKAALAVKRRFKNTYVICIVPDLAQYMSAGGNSALRKWYKNYNVKKGERYIESVDGFIILSKHMAEPLKIATRPYEVIEGIYNYFDEVRKEKNIINSSKSVLYAGTLAKRYGIMRLVNAFHKLNNEDARLVICGEGDAKPEIEKIAEQDKRISLLGNIPGSEVLKLAGSVCVLVNPRTPEGEFTKYSFPSKTMEYLASGTPTIMYKLPGIPEEYYNYSTALEDTSEDALQEKISDILSWSTEKRNEFGKNAREFILKQKNPEIQIGKLIRLIDTICQCSKTRCC